jgi:hypothetical protein
MVSMDIQQPIKRQRNTNLSIHLPSAFWAHLEYLDEEDGEDELVVQCAIGRHGPFIYIVNPRQQKRWQKKLREKEREEQREKTGE